MDEFGCDGRERGYASGRGKLWMKLPDGFWERLAHMGSYLKNAIGRGAMHRCKQGQRAMFPEPPGKICFFARGRVQLYRLAAITAASADNVEVQYTCNPGYQQRFKLFTTISGRSMVIQLSPSLSFLLQLGQC